MTTLRRARFMALLACTAMLSGCLGGGGSKSGAESTTPPTGSTSSTSVVPTNKAPTISGTAPTSAKSLQPYVFQPTATDPDGDTLTFTIENRPAWATFDATTGRLAGTPSSSYTGTFSGIRISVSDGKASGTLPAFDITVAPATAATGSATLKWVPPTSNVDGSPLTNLGGYVIRYGTSLAGPTVELRVTSPSITSAVVENLGAGTWYFTVSAYTTAGVESAASNAGSKTIV